MQVQAGGATLSGGGTITLDGNAALITGVAVAHLTIADQTIQGVGGVGNNTAKIVTQADSVIHANAVGNLKIDTSAAFFQNLGLMRASNGGRLLFADNEAYNSGTVIISDGGLFETTGSFINQGTFTFLDSQGSVVIKQRFFNQGRLEASGQITAYGSVSPGFNGVFFDGGGTIAPGGTGETAQLLISPIAATTGYDSIITGELEIELASDTEYDSLFLGGAGELGLFGTSILSVSFLEGFVPDASDIFLVLSHNSPIQFYNGNGFSNVAYNPVNGTGTLLMDDGLGMFTVTYDMNGVTLRDFQDLATPGDFDRDGDVDGNDFLVWQRDPNVGNLTDWETNYGSPPLVAPSIAVPEPSTTGALMLAFLGLSLRRCRQKSLRSSM